MAFELQATDYPRTRPDLPNHEPRGCQRGTSYSWYLYSPHRIKYPLICGRLLELYRSLRQSGKDPVEAWAAIQADTEKRASYTRVRGLGGFVRASWDEAVEIIAAANVYTVQTWGPDRIVGFSPIPAMSMISYAAGTRYLSLIGGVSLSFYDWYCDLPPSSPQVWGEQTDVPEAADWYNAGYIIVCGANLPMTRTPDAHFYSEVRYKGTKVVAIASDYAEYVKFADLWMPIKPGTDAAVFLAMAHVVLKEFFLDRQTSYFLDYVRTYTDLPMLVCLDARGDGFTPGRFLRASDFAGELAQGNRPEWKTVAFDHTGHLVVPQGSIGFRWGEEGKWTLEPKDAEGRPITLQLSLVGNSDGVFPVHFPRFDNGAQTLVRNVPVRRLTLKNGEVLVATVFDLVLAHYGLDRGLGGECAQSYDDPIPFTPAWAEAVSGIKRTDIIRTGREFAANAEKTQGRSMVILGAGVNHWYHNDMTYRAVMNLLHLCGCVGQSGGGWAHYVGQEKLRPQAGWAPIAFALDWYRPPRQMNRTSFFYFHTDQWRYETLTPDELLAATATGKYRGYTLADYNVVAQRLGWLPSAPHFNRSPIAICQEAEQAGCSSAEEIARYVVQQLTSGKLKFACEDIDAPENFPRNLFVWRANLLGTSAKGHEYFLKHLLGAQNGVLQNVRAETKAKEIAHRAPPIAKLDLLVDINFRLNSTGAYADIILPTATWYEKHDLNTTDMHPFIHPLTAAVDPAWESHTDWQIFKTLAHKFSQLAAKHLGVLKDLVVQPLLHDTPQELAQPFAVCDWKQGQCEPIPGKTLPDLKVVERNYPNIYQQFISLGPLLDRLGNGVKGLTWPTQEEIERLKGILGCVEEEGIAQGRPCIAEDLAVCEAILTLAPETNGYVAHRAWQALETKTGRRHTHLVEARREDCLCFHDLVVQPRKIITSPTWSGIESEEVSYTAGYTNIHEYIPFRTLTGRAHFYLDHEWMREFGESFCTFRPPVDLKSTSPLSVRLKGKPHLVLKWITPHSKWGIHSTYNDNLRMLHLFRGGPCVWVSEKDANAIGLKDNDWVEAVNANGATVARVVVSQRIPGGVAMMYHAQEKIVNVPGCPTTQKRGGILNSVTRVTVKPNHMIGGYAQFSYGFNYYGYGTVGSQRDEVVLLHKIEDGQIDWLERELTASREFQLNPDGVPETYSAGEAFEEAPKEMEVSAR